MDKATKLYRLEKLQEDLLKYEQETRQFGTNFFEEFMHNKKLEDFNEKAKKFINDFFENEAKRKNSTALEIKKWYGITE